MSINYSFELLAYGLMVVGLNFVAHRIAPEFAGVMLIFLVAGGLLTMILGVLGLRGLRRSSWPVVTLSTVAVLLLVQAVKAWFALTSGVERMKPVAVIYSLLVFFATIQVLNFARSEHHVDVKGGKNADSTNRGQ